jgi:type VI secretion system protein ImpL
LPWYAIIGPPGAGKTTALLNAGLEFPLSDELGPGAIKGVGGTRLCDWWFTDGAVLIDTAGRYTTQDSDAVSDRAGWTAFLDLLRRTRPRQPLNGVIVAIALADIAQETAARRDEHARAIRARIAELERGFGLRLPVYAVFTKADLLAGFAAYFDDLDRDQRAQVWGMTFPLGDTTPPAARFTQGFRPLLQRLDAGLLDRLQAETNPARRALIAGFPAQLASLQAPLAHFLETAFAAAPDAPAPLLRGAYLTSATQEGTPIDRLTGMLSRGFGLAPAQAARPRAGSGRSYFLTRLLRDVVFNEAMLVSAPPARARRRAALRAAAFAAVAVVALAGIGTLLYARAASLPAIDASRAALAAYAASANGLALDPVADGDLPNLLPLLDQARQTAADAATTPNRLARWLGLAQDAKLSAAARLLYRHALTHALLPRLIWRLEAQLRGAMTQPDVLFEATRVYLMLGGQGPMDAGAVRDWLTVDWQLAYPGAAMATLRDGLARHLDALLAEPVPAVDLDGDLVARARATFGRVSLAQRVYARIRSSAAAQRLPPWRPADALGPAGVQLFLRASGRPLSEGIAGFYTVAGFRDVMLPSLDPAMRQVAADGWVLGEAAPPVPEGAARAALSDGVVALYESDYVRAWDQMLSDLEPAAPRSLVQAAQGLYILAHPDSPLRRLLAAMGHELGLAAATAPSQPAMSAEDSDRQARFRALRGAQQTDDAAPPRPGHDVDDHYAALRDLLADSGPLDRALSTLGDLQQQLAKLAASGTQASAPRTGPDDPALALRAGARQLPQPLARWLTTLADSGIALRGGDPRQQVIAVYNGAGGVAALCAAAVDGHYPFVPDAAAEISLDDFTYLFAPGGAIDGFVNTLLKPYLDMSGKDWKPRSADGVPAPATAAAVAQFQRAAAIRDLFFPNGRSTPQLRVEIAPAGMDAHSTSVTLDVDGAALDFHPGRPAATQLVWPGPSLLHTASLRFTPPPATGDAGWRQSGPWALLRLLGLGKPQQSGGESSRVAFRLGERRAEFDLRAGASPQPLTLGLLAGFRCPTLP